MMRAAWLIGVGVVFLGWHGAAVATEPNAAYQTHCASCHGVDRLGGTGPALLPGNLERLRRPDAEYPNT